MSVEQTETQSAAVAKNPAGRVSLDQIKNYIAEQYYVTGAEALGGKWAPGDAGRPDTMTVCFLVMRNGFIVIGKSTPLDPANFNAELGRTFAFEDAIRQLWPLMAFARASNQGEV